ncbi:respiratory supercomplex factor 1, mitochondrial [Mycetomoellerius zeteki]|uniref:respiratory supercomplex factor 1, mitochondrial n=1 Tax=Mycetomoellerius zeteki TaxID=64791 RepID=UPI00084EAF2B|nr:PREDICTED: respiratory supercomplex factor 1, mitochondrial [Trachymyrmex zeteki]XP_018305672.1 PREDICTED: respiratory supercomplex factor 1, mitochondrial [Trachymyrmex zeteki]XP_018305674.1 PREDICTED: respiratory supercomplex factor 1, mitochondrial [Trachymyrmex zeteki]XP_018305675.1 PREDICTED: respiratory supercomplex factor 1, mitochondrial [Trachymyrmex zeteki]
MADSKPDDELDWVKIREDLDDNYITETFFQKAKRKTRENPLVPIGTFATVTALMQQYMMRARVGAQALTIVSVIAGFIMLPKSK